MWRRHRGLCCALIATAALNGTARLSAQTSAGDMPGTADYDAPRYQFVGLSEGTRILLRRDGLEFVVELAGATRPGNSSDRRRLEMFLENLLRGEELRVRPINPPPGETPEATPQALLFRVPDGLFINIEVVRQGYAKFSELSDPESAELFRFYQERARNARKGVWAPASARQVADVVLQPQVERKRDQPKPIGARKLFVTKSGKKYHVEGCTYLRSSSKPISFKDAIRRYDPCSRCKPPTRP